MPLRDRSGQRWQPPGQAVRGRSDRSLFKVHWNLWEPYPSFMDYITSPHLQVQIRGLDSAIRQATQAVHTGVHYIQELLTTFGTMHALTCDTAQLDAELRGRSIFPDPRLPSVPPPPLGSPTTRRMTSTSSIPAEPTIPPPRTPMGRPPPGIVVTTSNRTLSTAELRSSTARSRSRSHSQTYPRNL